MENKNEFHDIRKIARKINEEINDSIEYFNVYLATLNKRFLEMAEQELTHAEEFMNEGNIIISKINQDSPLIFYHRTEKFQHACNRYKEQKQKLLGL